LSKQLIDVGLATTDFVQMAESTHLKDLKQ